MHEASLVESLLEQVRDLAAAHAGVTKVTTIVVEIGPLSGVEADLVALAYQRLAPDFGLRDAQLEIRRVPLRVRCLTCHDERSLPDLQFHCAACGSREVDIVAGDAFVLQELQLETNESPSSDASSDALNDAASDSRDASRWQTDSA